jgi:hypothetical protein
MTCDSVIITHYIDVKVASKTHPKSVVRTLITKGARWPMINLRSQAALFITGRDDL